YPIADAAAIALDTVRRFLEEHERPELVRFVLFDAPALAAFAAAIEPLRHSGH
ncbi:MAG: RNase III inhibitor, partial [Planctomycetia bacterium]|nr:RNase III inhibitor [Planctomycetia bacterium]